MQTATITIQETVSPVKFIESAIEEARKHHKEPLIDRYSAYEGYKRTIESLTIPEGLYDQYERACVNLAKALNI